MFGSREYPQDRLQGLKKKKNIKKIRPGRSAMQWHYALRLSFEKYLQYGTHATVHGLLYIKTSFHLLFR